MSKLPQINFCPAKHRDKAVIKIMFDYDKVLIDRIKTLPGSCWSQTMKCWYVPDTDIYRRRFKMEIRTVSAEISQKLCAENENALHFFVRELQLKSYSRSTIITYRNEFVQLLQILGKVPVNSLSRERLRDYFVWCHTVQKLTENTIHSRLNAIKFYFEVVLKGEKFYWDIPRPKKRMILPKVLGEVELRRLFSALTFKKHKAVLFTAYSAGLRVSEVVKIKLAHIDRGRMQLLIENSKGKKDRYVGLSPILLDILEQYYRGTVPKPKVYLFEGEEAGQCYGVRSAQKVFGMAKAKAGIGKNIGFHSLRHSFATHLLEKGIDIRYIKDLLGHFDIRTTERYLHVRKDKLVTIVSPLDDLWKDEANW